MYFKRLLQTPYIPTILIVGTSFIRPSDTQNPNIDSKIPPRQVSYEEGVSLARELPGAIYFETEIEERENVLNVMKTVIQ